MGDIILLFRNNPFVLGFILENIILFASPRSLNAVKKLELIS